MRVIIKNDKDAVADWAANYVAFRIKEFKPTRTKPFVLGLPTGSTPLGMPISLNYFRRIKFHLRMWSRLIWMNISA